MEHRGAPNLLFREVASHPADFSRIHVLSVHNCPMLLLALCFAGGILCRTWWQPPSAVVATCLLLLTVAAAARYFAPRLAWLATAVAFVALGWAAVLLQPSRENTSLLHFADGLQRTLEGQVVSTRVINRMPDQPAEDEKAEDWERTDIDREVLTVRALRVEEVGPETSQMQNATGNVLITLVSRDENKAVPYLGCGSHIALTVRMHPPQRYRTPGAWNYADVMERAGTSALSVANVGTVRLLQPIANPLQCRFQLAQHWSVERIGALARWPWMKRMPQVLQFTPTDAAVLQAMLMGDRSGLDRNVRVDFERTASFHLFVVAGIHITLLMAAAYGLLRRAGVPLWGAVTVTIPILTAYAFLTGFGAPAQRALLMSVVFLVTTAISRERRILNALGTSALVMLTIDPHALTEASFQMTALSVIAVGGIAAPILSRTLGPCARGLKHIEMVSLDAHQPPYVAQLRVSVRMAGRIFVRPSWKHGVPVAQRIPGWLLRLFLLAVEETLLTFIAEAVMALPMAVYFHRLTPFAAPANLLALPLVGVLLASSMVTFLLSALHPVLAALPVLATAVLLHAVNAIIHLFSSLHDADVRVPAPATTCITVAVVLWAVATVCVREGRRWRGCLGIAAVIAAFGVILIPASLRVPKDGMSFTAVDVGQGDSLLVTTPEGKAMVIDAGGPTGPQEHADYARFDTGEDVVAPFLWHEKLRRVDVLAITHAHSDHLGGALAILRNFHPREMWLSMPSPALDQLLVEARRDGVRVRYLHQGDMLQLGSISVTTLSPRATRSGPAAPSNDDSLVLRLQYGRGSVLAMGDAERDAESNIPDEQLSDVTLLKVGHHGSNTSTTEDFLSRVKPQFAVISCGRGNRFGHPRMTVLQRLQAHKVATSRTDDMGTVSYLLRVDGTVVTQVLNGDE